MEEDKEGVYKHISNIFYTIKQRNVNRIELSKREVYKEE